MVRWVRSRKQKRWTREQCSFVHLLDPHQRRSFFLANAGKGTQAMPHYAFWGGKSVVIPPYQKRLGWGASRDSNRHGILHAPKEGRCRAPTEREKAGRVA